MSFSQVLQDISNQYEIGCVDYYNEQNPNPWQDAHDELSKAVAFGDSSILELAIDRYKRKIFNLIIKYKNANSEKRELNIRDAFVLADQEKVDKRLSIELKQCYACKESSADLHVMRDSRDNIYLRCSKCIARN